MGSASTKHDAFMSRSKTKAPRRAHTLRDTLADMHDRVSNPKEADLNRKKEKIPPRLVVASFHTHLHSDYVPGSRG